MPLRIDKIVTRVVIAGVDVTAYVEKSTCTFGFALGSSEAELTMLYLSADFQYWDRVQIWAGTTHTDGREESKSASDHAADADSSLRDGNGVTVGILRFDGYLVDLDFSLWPRSATVKCNGPLILAQRAIAPDDDAAVHFKVADPLATPSSYTSIAPGIDLSTNPDTGAPWTDVQIITWLLNEAGIPPIVIGHLGGVGRILGSVAFSEYVWKRGTSSLAFIQALDKVCLGFRTFEALGGTITRVQTTLYAPFDQTQYDHREGTDFLDGTLNRNAKDARNRVVVSGYSIASIAAVFVAVGASSLLPPGVAVCSDESPPSSPLIEFDTEDETDGGTNGLSCEIVANWRLSELRYPLLDCSFRTWRDDPYSPGQVAYLNSPSMDGINQSTFIKSVTIEVEAGKFTQKLECVSTAYRARSGAPILGLTLPASLAVNP